MDGWRYSVNYPGHCPFVPSFLYCMFRNYSPDMYPINFSFWEHAMSRLCRRQLLPCTIELKIVVNDFAANIDRARV